MRKINWLSVLLLVYFIVNVLTVVETIKLTKKLKELRVELYFCKNY